MDNQWMRAARVGDTDVLRQLLQGGMDPGRYVLVDEGMVSPTAEQVTALHLAAFGGHVAACRLLLEHGAELDAISLPEDSRSGGCTPLLRAAWGRSIPVVRVLVAEGANLEATDGLTGDTPLLISARSGQPNLCLLLLDQGAEPLAYNQDGDGALDLADDTTASVIRSWLAKRKACRLEKAWTLPVPHQICVPKPRL